MLPTMRLLAYVGNSLWILFSIWIAFIQGMYSDPSQSGALGVLGIVVSSIFTLVFYGAVPSINLLFLYLEQLKSKDSQRLEW